MQLKLNEINYLHFFSIWEHVSEIIFTHGSKLVKHITSLFNYSLYPSNFTQGTEAILKLW